MNEDLQFRDSRERPRVLIVEPKRDYLGVLASRIADAGYRVVTADTPQSALAELYRSRPMREYPPL